MPKKKKQRAGGPQKVHEDTSTAKLVMMTDGHRISAPMSGKTDCGEYVVGWHYGVERDVLCKEGCQAGQ